MVNELSSKVLTNVMQSPRVDFGEHNEVGYIG